MFINLTGLGDIVEPKAVPSGRYDLTISTAEKKDAKTAEKADNVQVSIGIDGHLDAPNITHFISMPKAGEDHKKTQFKLLMLKRFLTQFKVPYDPTQGFNIEDLPGCRANCMVSLEEPDEKGNVYNRLVLDRIPTEG